MSPEELIATLLKHKCILDVNPHRVSSDDDGLQRAYCVLCCALPEKRQTRYTHLKARRIYKEFLQTSKALFVLVATSVSMTALVTSNEAEIVPCTIHWWEQQPPSESFALWADTLLCTLNRRKRLGKLANSKIIFVRFLETIDTKLLKRSEQAGLCEDQRILRWNW